jgi:hypothetical protein
MLRLLGSVDTYTDECEPHPVTRRMIKVREAAAKEDLQKKPGLSNIFMAHLEKARQELSQIDEKKRKLKAPLLAAASKQQQTLADIKPSASIEASD